VRSPFFTSPRTPAGSWIPLANQKRNGFQPRQPIAAPIMSFGINPTNIAPIVLNGMQLEEVDQFRYLGTTSTPNGQSKDEIFGRIAQSRVAFGRLQRCLWSRSEIRRSTKFRIYQVLVCSILLYGCETWAARNHDLHAAEVFDRQCPCRILRIRLWDRVSNDNLLHRAHLQSVNGALLSRRHKWVGHVLRRPPGTLIRDIIAPLPPAHWRKRCGGQVKA